GGGPAGADVGPSGAGVGPSRVDAAGAVALGAIGADRCEAAAVGGAVGARVRGAAMGRAELTGPPDTGAPRPRRRVWPTVNRPSDDVGTTGRGAGIAEVVVGNKDAM